MYVCIGRLIDLSKNAKNTYLQTYQNILGRSRI